MSEIGHNRPPDMTQTASETMRSISDWMAENPVIQTEEEARAAKVFIDRGRLCIKDLEAERDKLVRPLNEQVKEINGHYRSPRETLQKVIDEIESRFTAFLRQEERKRAEAAREAARIAEEAERKAREAERLEQDAIRSANSGVLDVNVSDAVVQADAAFSEYTKASRFAARAEKDTKAKVGGGFSKAISLRNVETLTITDAHQALRAVGVTDDINAAIIKAARAYRQVWDELPPGIKSEIERKV